MLVQNEVTGFNSFLKCNSRGYEKIINTPRVQKILDKIFQIYQQVYTTKVDEKIKRERPYHGFNLDLVWLSNVLETIAQEKQVVPVDEVWNLEKILPALMRRINILRTTLTREIETTSFRLAWENGWITISRKWIKSGKTKEKGVMT